MYGVGGSYYKKMDIAEVGGFRRLYRFTMEEFLTEVIQCNKNGFGEWPFLDPGRTPDYGMGLIERI